MMILSTNKGISRYFIISRPSRDEDLEQIEELKSALEMKMREIEELKEIINNNNKKSKCLKKTL